MEMIEKAFLTLGIGSLVKMLLLRFIKTLLMVGLVQVPFIKQILFLVCKAKLHSKTPHFVILCFS